MFLKELEINVETPISAFPNLLRAVSDNNIHAKRVLTKETSVSAGNILRARLS